MGDRMPQVEEKQQVLQQQATIEKAKQVTTSADARSSLSSSEARESFALIDANVEASVAHPGRLSKVRPKITTTNVSQVVETTSTSSLSKVNVHEVRLERNREVNNNEPIVRNRNDLFESKQQATAHSQPQRQSQFPRPHLLPGLKMDTARQINRQMGQLGNGKQSSPSPLSPNDHTKSSEDSKQPTKQQQPSQTSSIPSYNSIFNSQPQAHAPKATDLDEELLSSTPGFKLDQVAPPAQKRRWSPLSVAQPGSRAPLRKQNAADNGRKLLVFNYEAAAEMNDEISYVSDESVSCYDDNDAIETNDEELDSNQEETNERLPFNSTSQRHQSCTNVSKSNGEQKVAKQHPGSAVTKSRQQQQAVVANSKMRNSIKRADSVQMHNRKLNTQQQHTKISFMDGHQQAATICQQFDQRQAANCCRKIDLAEQAAYLNCDCSSCVKRRKLVGFVQGRGSAPALAAPSYYHHQPHHHHNHNLGASGELSKSALLIDKGYPKTRVMHLVLKSIILVLCTLLLLLLLVGTAMLSFTLPQAVDKITNVSRSFNVTIAGRR